MTRKYLCCWRGKYLVQQKKSACVQNASQLSQKHSAIQLIVLFLSFLLLRTLKEFLNANIYLNQLLQFPQSPLPPLRHQSIKNTHTSFCGRIPLFNVGVVLGQGFFVVVLSPSRWGNSENVPWLPELRSVCSQLCTTLLSPAGLAAPIGSHFTF